MSSSPYTDDQSQVDTAPLQTAGATADLDGEMSRLRNGPWLGLVEDCVDLFDELERLHAHLDPGRQEMADHVAYRLRDILERSGLSVISDDQSFDRSRHEADPADQQVESGARIAETVSPGFAAGRRVFRRARVRLGDQ
jgi:molecular chaperone GrpE (heat shock protein)